MREIRFRSWNKIFKLMGDVSILEWYKNSGIIAYIRASNSVLEFQSDPVFTDGVGPTGEFVLMQYTGLKDKYKTEIFEGDILNVKIGSKYEYMEVYFKDGCFGWGKEHNNLLGSKDIEVVGNIYENEELLDKIKK